MRTLQEKYNAIQEGKFSKEHFLAEARMQQPQLITRFNGYNDAVQILKNRGMIAEVSTEESFKDYSNDALTDMIINLSRYEDSEDSIARVKAELARRKETLQEAKLTKKSLTDYRYKPTNDMDKYPYEQILRGIRVELETMGVLGTPTAEEYTKALAKVSKNLEKDSIYYTNQVAGVNPKVDLHDKMVTATAKNTVDTFNGMKKAALKEGFKKLIKKVLSENSNDLADLFDNDEEREERRYTTNDYGDHGPETDFGDEPEEREEEFELQEGDKSDSEYKSELADYLEDNQIYGYTDMIHDIMTGPDEEENSASLSDFLDDHQIYGYNKGIERIFANYPYDQHWKNQPDEDEADDISHPRGSEEASDEETFDDLFEVTDTEADKDMVRKLMTMYETEPSKFERLHKQAETQAATNKDIKYKHLLSLLNRAKAGALQSLANQDKYQASIEGMDEDLYEGKKSLSELLK